jgi:modulator of FtsH protease
MGTHTLKATGAETHPHSAFINKVLPNIYSPIAVTLLFSGVTAGICLALNLPYQGLLITLTGYSVLLFIATKFRNSGLNIVFIFTLTGFMELTLGTILSTYLSLSGGGQIVATSMAVTSIIFLTLSAYVKTSRKQLSFIGGFATGGFFSQHRLGFFRNASTVISCISHFRVADVCTASLSEQQYYPATRPIVIAIITLYVAIFNLLTSLSHLIGFVSNNEYKLHHYFQVHQN